MKRFAFTLMLLGLLATVALADVTGKWKATFETPNGTIETTFNLKAEGETLTGTVSGRMGETKITEGKVKGDDVSFAVVRDFGGNEMKFVYKGKVSGNEMKLTVDAGERNFEMTAKKVE